MENETTKPKMMISHIMLSIVTIVLLVIILVILVVKVTPVGPSTVYSSIDHKIAANKELSAYNLSGEPRITYLTQELIDNGKKLDAAFFKDAKPGNLMLEYTSLTAIFDEKSNKLVSKFEIKATPPDFAAKLSAHPELKAYLSKTPQIIIISADNLAQLGTQIQGLTNEDIGNYLIGYDTTVFLYDYNNDKIKNTFTVGNANAAPQAQQNQQNQVQFDTNAPKDFFTKLLNHPEMKGLENVQPVGGRVTETSLVQLKALNPNLASKVAIGDFVLSYTDRIVIYNYEKDMLEGVYQLNQQ